MDVCLFSERYMYDCMEKISREFTRSCGLLTILYFSFIHPYNHTFIRANQRQSLTFLCKVI